MAKSPDAFRSISEVAEWLGTQAHVLRFWESKFQEIAPVQRAGGRRYYRPDDMRLIGGIKVLLHDEGHTIKAVQNLLKDKGIDHVLSFSPELEDTPESALSASIPKVTAPRAPTVHTTVRTTVLTRKIRKPANNVVRFTMNPLPKNPLPKNPLSKGPLPQNTETTPHATVRPTVRPMQPPLFPELNTPMPQVRTPKNDLADGGDTRTPNLFADELPLALGVNLPQADQPLGKFPTSKGMLSLGLSMPAADLKNHQDQIAALRSLYNL